MKLVKLGMLLVALTGVAGVAGCSATDDEKSEDVVIDTERPQREGTPDPGSATIATTMKVEATAEALAIKGPFERPAEPLSFRDGDEVKALQATASLTSGFAIPSAEVDQGSRQCDPQAAVSSGWVVVLCTNDIGFYRRNGQLYSDVSIYDFFAPLAAGVGHLNDTRVLFDEYRQRFWVTTQVRQVGFHDRTFIAISKTSNPTSGWYMYSADATGDPGCEGCMDYQQIGISRDLFWFNNSVGPKGDVAYFLAQYTDANAAAQGLPIAGHYWRSLELRDKDGAETRRFIPVKSHDQTDSKSYTISRARNSLTHLSLWTVADPVGAPGIATLIDIPLTSGFATGTPDARQPDTNALLSFGPAEEPSVAALRNNQLVLVWHENYRFSGFATDSSVLRVLSLNPTNGAVNYNKRYGQGNVDYGFPSVDINNQGVAGIMFTRTSQSVYPEMRYVSFFPDGTNSGSILLKAGNGSLANTPDREPGVKYWSEVSETSSDPSNDGSFWGVNQYTAGTDTFGEFIAHVTP